MIKNIILDWSGTVVDDLDAVLNATNDVFREFGRAELSRAIFRAEFVLPLTRFCGRFLPEVSLERIDAAYHRRFQMHLEHVNLLSGAREFLEFCRQSGRELYVLSAMHADHFQVQMKNLGLQDYIRRSYVEVIDKEQEIKRVLDENHLSPAETAFIGNMVHDIVAAKKGSVLPIAVLTGFDTLEKLVGAGPSVIVNGLRDLQNLLGVPRQDGDEVFEILDQKATAQIGVSDEERASAQTVAITIHFRIFERFASLEDDFARTVDYSAVASEISGFVGAGKYRLIETLVTQLADHLMVKFPLSYLEVELKKFVLPETDHVSVRTVRRI
jgi:phosphoglycolate phosphatase